MKKNKSLGVNAAINALRAGLSIIFPLITYPYAIRVLHAEGIGKVNFASSIVSYFSLFASLGFSNYAVREGAKVRDDKEKFSRFASEILLLNTISTAISVIGLIICAFLVPKFEPYEKLILLLGTTIVFTTFGVDWINTVYEDFLYITLRTIVTEVISMILLFCIVRSENDVYQYALLTVISQAVVCVSNFFLCRKYVTFKFHRGMHLRKHLQPTLIFLANKIATTIYVNSDTTMLGWMKGDYYVGIYAISVKVYSVIKTMLAALYLVVVPRISYNIGKDDYDSVKRTYTNMFCDVLVLLLPASVGLTCVSREIITFMVGENNTDGILTLQILSVALVGAILNGLILYCINIPTGNEKINARAAIYSTAMNVILNLFLIPIFKQNGAAATTVISEFFVLLYCLKKDDGNIKMFLSFHEAFRSLLQALCGVLTVIVTTVLIKQLDINYLLCLALIVIISVVAYGIELLLLGNTLVIDILQKIRARIHHI